MFRREWLKLYFIFGQAYQEKAALPIIEEALRSGITMFQLREKGPYALSGSKLIDFGKKVRGLCAAYGVPFVVNDDIELAIKLKADGVHIGQEDMHIGEAREILPPEMFIGVSATNVTEANRALKDGADYIGVGPIFQTSTKEDAKKPIGFTGLKDIKASIGDMPVVAIGGLAIPDAPILKEIEVDGVAVISQIGYQDDIERAVKAFLLA
ncbi:thiamine-phosphate synthase 1 [Halolactibacillus alkaliphilus]|uniref:Thiamine-phosphate synthase n=1 Tax=Halolactibacillus alkaliphilus TaxID=442899 RepID=A0A511X3F7_9BACI|nr:thiamine phosphate synthase [Halolactibacillus alkaliphilus]GEN57473.1 thiamine-phosphate synthase 1 [Halolactibacillus alkaliphilus]GGN73983.1 thiamine-phosphate synthase 1 [Halolactibacillus alkaliphilus]SFO99715.1 thiamine-phosphate pyrophosphorylase [Halolactibacillus alkaliphilus]